jgi:hypothetical protein
MAWSTERKNRARDNAERLGRAQTAVELFVKVPAVQVAGFFGTLIIASEWIESIKL